MQEKFTILLTAATLAEIEPTIQWLRDRAKQENRNVVEFESCVIEVFVSGVGPVATAYSLGRRLALGHTPDLAIQAGIAGAIDRTLRLRDVVQVSSDRFGDAGAQEADGTWLSLADLGFGAGAPFDDREILRLPPGAPPTPFPEVAGVTVSQGTGTTDRLQQLRVKWPEAQVETMEGAAFFLACLDAGVSPVQLRSISNYVEARNRAGWDLSGALTTLNDNLRALLAPFVLGGSTSSVPESR